MGKLDEQVKIALGAFTEITDIGLINDSRFGKEQTVWEIKAGINRTFPNLQSEPREKSSSLTEGMRIKLPKGPTLIPESGITVTGIELIEGTEHILFSKPKPTDISERIIQVSLLQGKEQIQLRVGKERGGNNSYRSTIEEGMRAYVSYRDSSFGEAEPPYFPHGHSLRPPVLGVFKSFPRWRDITLGALEEIEVAIVVDSALRASLGEDRGFPNLNNMYTVHSKLLRILDSYPELGVPLPPAQFHEGIRTLYDALPKPALSSET